ncbi:hypothetical protein GOV14_00920 [Candidatus Pacearchaeota archaeon]|nr:hypothetical protein [Candidatus Pacearchaeota archaeon]
MGDYQGITGKKSNLISIIFFILGLIGAVGFRIVLLLSKINSLYASIAWYLAIVSYLFFYSYRLYIEERRRKIIVSNRLRKKVSENSLDEFDRMKLKVVLDSILVSKAKWNFFLLLILSIAILLIQIVIDILL